MRKFLYIAVGAPEGDGDPASTGTPAAGDAAPAAPSTGDFVSRSDYEKLQSDLRSTAGRLDKLSKELAAPPATPASTDNDGGFDPVAFRRDLLRDTANVVGLSQAAVTLKAKYPHADPSLFGDRLTEFGSPEALEVAAQGSHTRVQSALDEQKTALEKSLLEDFSKRYGVKIEGAAGPQGSNEGGQPGGDPTPDQFARLSFKEQQDLEKAHPGISDRILKAAGI